MVYLLNVRTLSPNTLRQQHLIAGNMIHEECQIMEIAKNAQYSAIG